MTHSKNSCRSPSTYQDVYLLPITAAATTTKQPFTSVFLTDQHDTQSFSLRVLHTPAPPANIIYMVLSFQSGCHQHSLFRHFRLRSRKMQENAYCSCTATGSPWNPSKISAAFQITSERRNWCLATCLRHSLVTWTSRWPNPLLSSPQTAVAPALKHIYFLIFKCLSETFPREAKTF